MPATNTFPPEVFIAKESRGLPERSIPAVRDHLFMPRTSDALPSDGSLTIGTGAPSTRERKFVASAAANRTTGGGFDAITTSELPAVNVTAVAASVTDDARARQAYFILCILYLSPILSENKREATLLVCRKESDIALRPRRLCRIAERLDVAGQRGIRRIKPDFERVSQRQRLVHLDEAECAGPRNGG